MPSHRFEKTLERAHGQKIAEQQATARDHIVAQLEAQRRIARQRGGQFDVSVVRGGDERVHADPAQDAAAETPAHELALAAHDRKPALDRLNGRVESGKPQRVQQEMRALHQSEEPRAVERGHEARAVREAKTGHRTRGQELTIKDLVWRDADTYRSLWSWIKRHDLVGRVVWLRAPLDDPAPELFVEPRLLHTEVRDGFWLRIVDAPAALASRGYLLDESLTIEIAQDELAPWNTGRFSLYASRDGATTEPTTHAADLTMTVKTLASLFTGMRSARQLKNWGLIVGDDRAIDRATRLFATRFAPHCPDNF